MSRKYEEPLVPGFRVYPPAIVPGIAYPIDPTTLEQVAQDESPVLAWLMDAIANWSCEECGNLLCEHAAQTAREDLAVDVIMQMLSVLAVTVLPHRSTGRAASGLGGRLPKVGEHAQCEVCVTAWPCAFITEFEERAKPLASVFAHVVDPYRIPVWDVYPPSRGG